MIETELKITLDAGAEARLRRHPALAKLRACPPRTSVLVSVYFDTAEHALARAGVALRLRKVGRRWVQTVKRGSGRAAGGLHTHVEAERPAPGGRLALNGPDPEGVMALIAEVCGDAPLAPVFETRVRRTVERLRAPAGGEVELAIDRGEIVAGEARAPVREAEFELASGEVDAVYDVARRLFTEGPVRFADANKATRGYRLARGEDEPPPRPRAAGLPGYEPDDTVESVATAVFRDCLAQVSANMAIVADSEEIEGPHQLRVGLRRLRTAFGVFSPFLGEAAITPLSAEAGRLGRVVGALRDLDVLADEVVAAAVDLGLDAEARGALVAVLAERRRQTRADVRAALAAPAAVGFLFDLGRLIEARGWLAPSDHAQTARLATPISEAAPAILDARRAKVMKRGRRIRKLDAEGLHALRKELKKLRYAADMLDPIYPGKRVEAYVRALKQLQDIFGSLNDAAMAADYLAGAEAPGHDSPAAQRGIGWVLGTLAVRAEGDRPALLERWDRLVETGPFWS
jgi:inorganic triphosphatase YgiF